MKINFDEYIERRNTNCVKWDNYKERFAEYDAENLLPMWIADMDFKAPQPVINALGKRVSHGIFGYTCKPDSFYNAIINWVKRRYNWEIQKDWVVYTPGVIPGFTVAIQALTQPGDGVIIQTPVYYPFADSIKNNGRIIKNSQLKIVNGHYEMDFQDLAEKASDPNNKLLIISNPHNPVGRVWTLEELERLADICLKNDVKIVSDEIHGDIIFKGYNHIPLSTLGKKVADITITTYSPSKTFNVAGLQTAYMVIPSDSIREQFNKKLTANRVFNLSAFGQVALEAAYNESEDYLIQLLEYLEANLDYMEDFVKRELKNIKLYRPEGTYLVWVDFSGTGMSNDEIKRFIIEKAKIAVDQGDWFGEGGECFARFNIACPRSILEKAMKQLKNALENNGGSGYSD